MWPDPQRTREIATRMLYDRARHSIQAIAGYDFLGYHLASAVCAISYPDYPVTTFSCAEQFSASNALTMAKGGMVALFAGCSLLRLKRLMNDIGRYNG